MKQINQNDVSWLERRSPKGRYHRFRRDLFTALSRPEAGPELPARPPFDVEVVRLPSGAANFPYHSHSAERECYVVVSGSGTMRAGEARTAIRAGDCLLCPPGEPHQLINDGPEDLLYFVIANNDPSDFWYYPDSDKWGIPTPDGDDLYFRPTKVDYYDREE
jgi:uncharacterized cupin superfamily protein